MDPLTQGLFGAGLSQYAKPAKHYKGLSLMVGFLSGMAADLDILIQSQQDPLLFLHFHRQFSHSLIFIPVAALIVSGALYYFLRNKISFSQIYLFSFLGYATHGLLDAATSYGTQLLWPFSEVRIAWNLVSVIDPLVTLPMLVLMTLMWIKKRPLYGKLAFAYLLFYLCLGFLQQHRATEAIELLALERGHKPDSYLLKPTLGNILLWRSIYRYDGSYYVDAVRVAGSVQIYRGHSVAQLQVDRDLPWLQPDGRQANNLQRFRRYSNGYLAFDKGDPHFIYDIRYSMSPDSIKPLWGIRLSPDHQEQPVEYWVNRDATASDRLRFKQMLLAQKN